MDVFGQLKDPRIDRRKLHPMPEILLLTLCAVICSAESWDDIELSGEAKLDFLHIFLAFKNSVSSDGTLRRFFEPLMIKPYAVAMMAHTQRFTWYRRSRGKH